MKYNKQLQFSVKWQKSLEYLVTDTMTLTFNSFPKPGTLIFIFYPRIPEQILILWYANMQIENMLLISLDCHEISWWIYKINSVAWHCPPHCRKDLYKIQDRHHPVNHQVLEPISTTLILPQRYNPTIHLLPYHGLDI